MSSFITIHPLRSTFDLTTVFYLLQRYKKSTARLLLPIIQRQSHARAAYLVAGSKEPRDDQRPSRTIAASDNPSPPLLENSHRRSLVIAAKVTYRVDYKRSKLHMSPTVGSNWATTFKNVEVNFIDEDAPKSIYRKTSKASSASFTSS
jgi:hypothetical protein